MRIESRLSGWPVSFFNQPVDIRFNWFIYFDPIFIKTFFNNFNENGNSIEILSQCMKSIEKVFFESKLYTFHNNSE